MTPVDNKELTDLKIEFASFTAKVTEWMNTTTEYRQHLCQKIDKLFAKNDEVTKQFAKLPCPKREWMSKAIYILYGVDILLVGAVTTAFVTHIAK